MPKDEIKKCPDPRCKRGKIFSEGNYSRCMTCDGKGEGTEEFFQENREKAQKERSALFEKNLKKAEEERREFIDDACAL